MSPLRASRISSWWWRVKRGEKRAVLAAGAAVVVASLLAIVVVACSGQPPAGPDSVTIEGSTSVDAKLYRDPQMHAIAAAREDSRFDPIAETPQAKWFSDWSTTASVNHDIRDYLWGAALANAIPTIVLYRIPHLDCGGPVPGEQVYTGARDAQEYNDWVDGAAAALTGHSEAIVILEPDALPQLGDCQQGDRVGMLRHAVEKLSATGARVYIDAGHENWLTAAEAAKRLKSVGVDKVAGFSLNVSNFNPTKGEVRYAESVRIELEKLGVTDAHYLIDVGRNGAGTQDDTCNPPGARLGHAPALFYGGALDGLLWVKNPGETDGSACRGGPDVGFWPAAALRLLGVEEAQAAGARSATGWLVLSVTAAVALAAVLGWAVVKRRRNTR